METFTGLSAFLRSLYEDSPEGIAFFDARGVLVSCNAAALRMAQLEDQQIAGVHFTRAIARHHRKIAQAVFDGALCGARDEFETLLVRRDGTTLPVEIAMFPACRADGAVEGVFVLVRDAVSLQAAEQALSISQQRFRSLFEYHPDAIVALKHDGTVSRVNVAFERTTGFFGEQLIGKPFLDVFDCEHHEQAWSAFKSPEAGTACEFEAFLIDKNGGRIEVFANVVPLRVDDDVEGAYIIAKDVRAQRRAEQAITLQSERIRELYLAASARGKSVAAQIDNTLALGCRLFGFDHGYVTRYDGENLVVLNNVGDYTDIIAGTAFDLEGSFSRHLLGDGDRLFIEDLDAPPWCDDPARQTMRWRSYLASKLVVNDADFGTLVFGGGRPHPGMSELDFDLLALMTLFVAAALERARHTQAIEHLAFFDSLTGLPNRVLFNDRIKQTIAAAKRYGRGFALMFLDLDEFKHINDTAGHAHGDKLLKAVSERLTGAVRESDTIARFGGDEFVVLQPVVNGSSDAADLARKLLASLAKPLTIGSHCHEVSTSIGIALYPADGTTHDALLEAADHALYAAKRAGRNTWAFSSRHP